MTSPVHVGDTAAEPIRSAENAVAPTDEPGSIEGFVDLVDSHRIRGWAYDPSAPWRRLLIDISDGNNATVVLANIDRPDLLQAGKGDGFCGFDVEFDVASAGETVIRVRDLSSGIDLAGSPVRFDLLQLLGSGVNRGRLDTLRSEAHLALLTLTGRR